MAETSRRTTPRGPESGGSRNGVGPDGGPRAWPRAQGCTGLGTKIFTASSVSLSSLMYCFGYVPSFLARSPSSAPPSRGAGHPRSSLAQSCPFRFARSVPGQRLGQLSICWSGGRCLHTFLSSCVSFAGVHLPCPLLPLCLIL